MKYIDSGLRAPEQTVGFWMQSTVTSKIREFRCQAGYFTLDGASLLVPLLKKCASDGAIVRLLLGSNGGATLASHIAFLAGTLGLPQRNVSLGVVSFDNCLFHPKVYHFVREDGSQTAYVGSANLTDSGISGKNVEAGIILDSTVGDDIVVLREIETRIESWFAESPVGLSHVTKFSDIDDLLASGFLSLTPQRREREIEEEGEEASTKSTRPRANLKAIFKLPTIEEDTEVAVEEAIPSSTLSAPEKRRFVRNTESSYHYPQGTHLGHLLAILWYFSQKREGTAFDDKFMRLEGSLGSGRLAAYRRQVKYKMQAAIELGLISDIRLFKDSVAYIPTLTDTGRRLWSLLAPFIDTDDLILESDESGLYSSRMPKPPSFYNELLQNASAGSLELQHLYRSIVLNMPAVKQMLKLLYHQERKAIVTKAQIYESFFDFEPVRNFCDAMGIEPGTVESAKHRCPFLLNILESCNFLEQESSAILVGTLGLSPDLLVSEGSDISDGIRLLPKILTEWGKKTSVQRVDLDALRMLFGAKFLTYEYYLKEVVEIPVKHVE